MATWSSMQMEMMRKEGRENHPGGEECSKFLAKIRGHVASEGDRRHRRHNSRFSSACMAQLCFLSLHPVKYS